jgi:hypothetical protein
MDRRGIAAIAADQGCRQGPGLLERGMGGGIPRRLAQAALNWLVDNYPGLADCFSSVDRLPEVLHALDEIEGLPPPAARLRNEA